jgi:hypothetical protein
MNNIEIKDISLGGIGFIQSSKAKHPYEIHKVYELKLKADVPWENNNLSVKIAIIRATENAGYRSYGAVYRNLTDAQLTELKNIISFQKGINESLSNAGKTRRLETANSH